jgi:hypothetical protein
MPEVLTWVEPLNSPTVPLTESPGRTPLKLPVPKTAAEPP